MSKWDKLLYRIRTLSTDLNIVEGEEKNSENN